MFQKSRIAVSTALLLALLTSASAALAAEPTKKAPEAPARKSVNINTADASQLALLPRIGPSVAQRVVDFRKQNGPFKRVEDLMLVRGIGEKTFLLLKPYVATSGETTLREKVRPPKGESAKGAKEADR